MIKHILIFCLLFLGLGKTFATHNRAGEIRLEQIGSLTLRATIITYTKASSVSADRPELPIIWGDGTIDTLKRVNGGGAGDLLQGDIKRNFYIGTHTFPGRGTYHIGMMDPNRNGGILNVNFPNSDLIPFYIQTSYTFLSSNFQGFNSTPQILQPPVDKGCVGKVFIHSLNAYDPDGDSLAFRLITPLQANNVPVPFYIFPDKINPGPNNTISLDERTGQFVWRTPQKKGEYNIAFQIISYRGGVAIDTTIRDMQVVVDDCNDNPPNVQTIEKICVVAGTLIKFSVRGTDPDVGDKITLTALGGPFVVPISPATFKGFSTYTTPPLVDNFIWQTTCEHIAQNPYIVVFKAQDNFYDTTGLVDLKTVQIKVAGPPPLDVRAVSTNGSTVVSWQKPYICENAADKYFFAFSVWRKEGSNPFTPDTCNPVIEDKGYDRIAFDTMFAMVNQRYTFTDKNVESGKTYCYRIVAHFAKRTSQGNPYNLVESLPSNEACVQLQRSLPLIINVSVEQTDVANGTMTVRWIKPLPLDLDTVQHPGPYKFVVQRATGITTTGTFADVPGATFSSNSFAQLNDTAILDTKLATLSTPYTYRITFYFKTDSLLGYSGPASSHFLTVKSSDKVNYLSWDKRVPWTNIEYAVLRLNNVTGIYDSIGKSITTSYVDTNLINKKQYCYYIRAIGTYNIVGINSPLINLSQKACGTPLDTVPPCPTTLTVCNLCNPKCTVTDNTNVLMWLNPKNICKSSADVAFYTVYFSDTKGGTVVKVTTINNPLDTSFIHLTPSGTVAGCYYITSTDSVGNESVPSNTICVDNCPTFQLPNAFTPNGDKQNDTYHATQVKFIDHIDMKIFNRWGQLVNQFDRPDFNWDGKNFSGNDLAVGTYYYSCVVYEKRVGGIVANQNILTGYIELIR